MAKLVPMALSREQTLDRLLKSFKVYYNITLYEDEQTPIAARCDFFEHSQKYVLSQKAELWAEDSEEFLYLLEFDHLTLPLYEQWRDYVYEDGMSRLNVGPGHMYSFITPVFVCDTCDADAKRALKRCRIYKSFHFSLHGWMDYHAALVELQTGEITANRSGHTTAKLLKNVLYSKK